MELFTSCGVLPALQVADGRAFITTASDACTKNYFYESEYSNAVAGRDFGKDRFVDPNAIEGKMAQHEGDFIRAIKLACDYCEGGAALLDDAVDATDVVFDFAMHTVSRNPRALPGLVNITKRGLGASLYALATIDAQKRGRPEELEACADERAKRFILADSRSGLLSHNTYQEWRGCRRLLLKAPAEKVFLTSDFPVCGQGRDGDLEALFLPLSSNVAVLFSEKGNTEPRCECALLQADGVDMLNAMQMRSQPERKYLYGGDCEYLRWLYEAVALGNLSFPNLIGPVGVA